VEVKPVCKLSETDGNVFVIISRVTAALKKAGKRDKAQEFADLACKTSSYDEVLRLCFDFVDVR
jgi:hypothetical protein